jgi:hypothetical protein
MKKKLKSIKTHEEIAALKVIANASFDLMDEVRSVLHSAAIKKGHGQPKIVSEEISKNKSVIKNELEVFIPYTDVNLPENYSQSSGYTVDIYVETKNEILLIDPKGAEHNNNTPISDEVKKWTMAKEQVQKSNPNKVVKFILLKPKDVNQSNFNRLKTQYLPYGIELYITDDFLSEFRKETVDVSTILNENKKILMSNGIRSLL